MRRTAAVVTGGAALITGAIVWGILLFPGVSLAGSGGLGAVSVGISDGVLYLSLLASAIANRLFARAARVWGGIVRRVHQVQSVALLLLAVTVAAMFASGNANPHSGLWYVLIAGLLFGFQLLLLAILLGLFLFSARPAAAS